jgi:hypothetical protein
MRTIAGTIGRSKKLFMTSVMSILFGASLVLVPAASAISIGGPSDCDGNAIINCGAHSTSALMQAYNSSAYVQKVYAYFGISNADMANLASTNVAGRVTKDGNVFVDGQSRAVASNAVTGGRQNIAGSKQVTSQGATFFVRPPSVSFQQSSLPAFVSMKNGQFQFAVIASCGNAVRAAPAKPPTTAVAPAKPVSQPQTQAKPAPKPTSAPAPAPTQSQSQSQSQQVNVNNTNVQKVQTAPQPQTPAQQPQTASSTPAEQPAAQQTETQPSKLVNTGPTGLAAIFIASSLAGTFAFRRLLLHKFNNGLDQ